MRPKTIATALLAALASSSALAQQPAGEGWVGKRVVTQHGAVLNDPRTGKLDDKDRAKNLAIAGRDRVVFRIYKVEAVKGRWLWLHDENSSTEGWVDVSWIVPFDQAVDFFTAQIRTNPGSSVNYILRAAVWWHKGESDLAIADYNEAMRLDPRDESVYNNRGAARCAKKEYDKAIADYNEAIRLDPKYALAYNNRGVAWEAKKEYDKAIADYGEAIRIDPKDADGYNGRAWLRATCPEAKYRDGKAAVEDATKACELSEWKDPNSIATLAAAYAERGDFAKAVETQERALAIVKDRAGAERYRGRLALYEENKPYRQQ